MQDNVESFCFALACSLLLDKCWMTSSMWYFPAAGRGFSWLWQVIGPRGSSHVQPCLSSPHIWIPCAITPLASPEHHLSLLTSIEVQKHQVTELTVTQEWTGVWGVFGVGVWGVDYGYSQDSVMCCSWISRQTEVWRPAGGALITHQRIHYLFLSSPNYME